VSFAKKNVIDAKDRFGKGAGKLRAKRSKRELRELFEKDLAKSGIDLVTAKKLGLRACDADEMWAALHPRRAGERPRAFTAAGYVIPFWQPNGERMDFIRVRKLAGKWNADDKDKQRYNQPPNTVPRLYLPRAIMDLPKPGKDGRIKIVGELVISEGEKKAISANLCKILTMALAGVWNFGSAKYDLALLTELRAFDLSEADLILCFDTDHFDNENVRTALRRFMYALRRELHPRSIKEVRLTGDLVGGKLALDDWLATLDDKPTARTRWMSLERTNNAREEAFAHFNSEIVHTLTEKRYYDVERRGYYRNQRNVIEQYALGEKVPSTKSGDPVFPIVEWIEDRPSSSTVHDVIYVPGKPERFRTPDSGKHDILNLWRPSTVEATAFNPKNKEDWELIKPFTTFFDHFTGKHPAAESQWFLQWLAYPLQNLGQKMMSAVCAVSKATGTGKGFLFFDILNPLYGGDKNAPSIDASTLASKYNSFMLSQLLLVDEVHTATYFEQYAMMARLKRYITEPSIDHEEKFVSRRNMPNYANLYMTSNFPNDALRLDEDDRRFFILDAPDEEGKKAWTAGRFEDLHDWLHEQNGLGRVLGYLRSVDLSGFSPRAAPPRTVGWHRMQTGKDGAFADIAAQILRSPAVVVGSRYDLFEPHTIAEGLSKYAHRKNMHYRGEINSHTIAPYLKDVPKRTFEAKRNGRRTSITVYALFHGARWDKQKTSEWKAHWQKSVEDGDAD
jgi:hypothetical protein